ncbi:MAG: hypothetical protein A3K19_31590 [Lentisphaerae bacterium RIFOXYB12_FULL_65_16]|nr:MAG: hypothetical protein A3K18_03875 [Lentisphaerae bacterium RIFOXYA12_64_32]OGV88647.1 MAG: hypothetical protein A3K19_31590 [Lentisphaerae bacterium RIFOXYB12_FULL_65_16]
MKLFFDTSALAKYFHDEDGTDRVTGWIQAPGHEIQVLELVRLEFLSACQRRFRNGEIGLHEMRECVGGFEEELAGFEVEPFSRVFLREAERLIQEYGKEHGLRSLDAIHLAAFSLLAENDWVFVTADAFQTRAGRAMGMHVLNPLEPTPDQP